MISVIICSVKPVLAQQVKANIGNTIGVQWEVISIDNRSPSRSITEVYNEGVRRAKYPIICFVHEDVGFLTHNWGALIVNYFQADPQLGMIGIAGASYKSKTLSGWTTLIAEYDKYNVIHLDKSGNKKRMFADEEPKLPLKEVVVLDGVFLCTRREIVSIIPFDEQFLTGFHLYDIDISFRISQVYTVAVSFEIDLVHYTEGGDFGNSWVENTIKWHRKYAANLPRILKKDKFERFGYEKENKVRHFWLKRLRKENITFKNRLKWVIESGAIRYVGLWPDILFFLVAQPVVYLQRKKTIRRQRSEDLKGME